MFKKVNALSMLIFSFLGCAVNCLRGTSQVRRRREKKLSRMQFQQPSSSTNTPNSHLSIRFLKLLISDGRVSNFAGPSRVLISTTLVADSWASLFWLSTMREIGSGILYVWLESSYCVHVYVWWQDTSHFQCLSLLRGTNHHWKIAQKTAQERWTD